MELITAIATFFTALNGWTVGTVILCIFVVPPALGLVAVYKVVGAMSALKDVIRTKNELDNNRFETTMTSLKDEIRTKNEQDSKRFEAMVGMFNQQHAEFSVKYDNNIYLVKNWEKTAGDMANLIYLNTQAMTSLGGKFDQLIGIWSNGNGGRKG